MGELNRFMDWVIGIEDPWKVVDVEHTGIGADAEIHVRAEVPFGTSVRCPACGKECKVHDRLKDRTWRNLDVASVRTYVHAKIPRSDCPECGIRQIDVPWAREGSRFTLMMESMMLSLVRQMPVSTVANMMHETAPRIWRMAINHADDLVDSLDLSRLKRVGVDEKCFSGHDGFITVFMDMDTHRIVFVTEGKGSDTVRKFRYFLRSHRGSVSNITDFSCDMGAAYISGIRKHFRCARITIDRFHLVKLANKALNDTKCGELKLMVNRMKARYLLLRKTENLSDEDRELRDRICMDNEILGIAFRLKESLCSAYLMDDADLAKEHLQSWIRNARFSKLYHFVKLADTVERHISHILQWFSSKLTNSLLEGTNSMISVIKSRARGFRHPENLIAMCYLVSAQEKTDMYGRGM